MKFIAKDIHRIKREGNFGDVVETIFVQQGNTGRYNYNLHMGTEKNGWACMRKRTMPHRRLPFRENNIYNGELTISNHQTEIYNLKITTVGRVYKRVYHLTYWGIETFYSRWEIIDRRVLIEKTGNHI